MINEVVELQAGKEAHKKGDLANALNHYEKILSVNSRNADALHLVGLIYKARGDVQKAISYIKQAIDIAKVPLYYSNLGVVYYDQQMYPEAVDVYAKLVGGLDPRNIDGYIRLAALWNKLKRPDVAIQVLRTGIKNIPSNLKLYSDLLKCYREEKKYLSTYHCLCDILEFDPNNAEIVLEIGTLYLDVGDEGQALWYIDRALTMNPKLTRAYYYLGMILKGQNKLQEAEAAFRKALAFKENAFIYNQLSLVVRDLGKMDEGMECMRKACVLDPNNEGFEFNLANYLFFKRNYKEAEEALNELLRKHPNNSHAYNLLSILRIMQSRKEESLRFLEKAIELSPDDETLKTNYGIMLLSLGNMKEGWKYYEHRYSYNDQFKKTPALKLRNWIGQDLSNKTLYIITEQGAGDYFHFLRYIPLIKERFHPKKIYLQTLKPVADLVKENFSDYVEVVVTREQVPSYDFHCAITSLGFVFDTTLETIPQNIPYIHARKADVKKWSERMPRGKELNVGLVWAGNVAHKNNYYRSMHLSDLSTLLDVKNCKFYNLQVGDRADEVEAYKNQVMDLRGSFKDYAQTAAAIECLDLVISVDTSVVHLAGAMGKHAWVLIPFNPDWRWMHDRVDTPWYPTLKLFRQKEPLLWAPVVEMVKKELMQYAQRHEEVEPVGKAKKTASAKKHDIEKKRASAEKVVAKTQVKAKKKTSK
jgi:tetratricopeptide (TPR) repeat protein